MYGNVVKFRNGRFGLVTVLEEYDLPIEDRIVLIDLNVGYVVAKGIEITSDLMHRNEEFIIDRVYKDYTYGCLLWAREQEEKKPKITQREKDILLALETLGYTYIARGEDDGLCAYQYEPMKSTRAFSKNDWETSSLTDYWMYIPDQDLFSFIFVEDKKPYCIGELKNAQLSK